MNEKISALIDAELNELDERRVLEAVKHDPELQSTWERYYLIRAAMKRQLSVLASPDMPERVRSRLEEAEQDATASLRFWPLAGGFAAAAAIAVVAIFGLQTLRSPVAPVPVTQVAVDSSTPSATPVAVEGSTPAVSTSTGAGVTAATVTTSTSAAAPAPNPEEQLNFYLVGHNEFMPTGGMGNMLPYVRVVADNPDK